MATHLDLSLRDARVPLGVSTAFVINKAYHTRALECHPDKNPTTNPSATQDLSTALGSVAPVRSSLQDQGDSPAGGVHCSSKRKRTGGSLAKKQAVIKSATSEGGFVDKGRMTYRAEGGILATGNERSCLPDALYVLLRGLDHPVDLEDVRTIMPVHGDTLFSVRLAPVPSWSPAPPPSRGTHTPCSPPAQAADEYVHKFGLELSRVTKDFMGSGGLAFQLLQVSGSFVVQLRVTYGKDDTAPDLHCVAYDGLSIKDNYKYAKVKILEESDRSLQGSRAVFDSLLPDLQVRVMNVYQLRSG